VMIKSPHTSTEAMLPMDSGSVSLWRSGLVSTFIFSGKELVLKGGEFKVHL
jgi:hypothetical protein